MSSRHSRGARGRLHGRGAAARARRGAAGCRRRRTSCAMAVRKREKSLARFLRAGGYGGPASALGRRASGRARRMVPRVGGIRTHLLLVVSSVLCLFSRSSSCELQGAAANVRCLGREGCTRIGRAGKSPRREPSWHSTTSLLSQQRSSIYLRRSQLVGYSLRNLRKHCSMDFHWASTQHLRL